VLRFIRLLYIYFVQLTVRMLHKTIIFILFFASHTRQYVTWTLSLSLSHSFRSLEVKQKFIGHKHERNDEKNSVSLAFSEEFMNNNDASY